VKRTEGANRKALTLPAAEFQLVETDGWIAAELARRDNGAVTASSDFPSPGTSGRGKFLITTQMSFASFMRLRNWNAP